MSADIDELLKLIGPPTDLPATIRRDDGAGLIRDLRTAATHFIAIVRKGRPIAANVVSDFAREISWLGWLWNQRGRRPTPEEMELAWAIVDELWNSTNETRKDSIDLRCCLSGLRSELLEFRGEPRGAAIMLSECLADMDVHGEPRMKHLRRLERLWLEGKEATKASAISAERISLSLELADSVFGPALAHVSPVLAALPVIRDYADHISPSSRGGIVWFRDLPWEELEPLAKSLGEPFLDLERNQAPSARELISVTKPHKAETFFSGMVVLPPRKDARVTIDGVITRPTRAVTKWKKTADDFALRGDGESVWVWWD